VHSLASNSKNTARVELKENELKAIILAAGKNIRLNSITELPKSLLRIGDLCFLDRIIVSCKKHAIHQIVIVVGYKAEEIERHIEENTDIFGGLHVKTIYNPEYANKNNLFSFWLAHREMNNPFVLFNSDVLFHPQILQLLLKNVFTSALMIDDTKNLDQEEMKVIMNEKRLIEDISKKIDPLLADGEYIGMAKFFDRKTIDKILWKCKSFLDCGRINTFYEEALRSLSIEEPSIHGISTNGLPWIEVDTPQDYEEAKNTTYPKIVADRFLDNS